MGKSFPFESIGSWSAQGLEPFQRVSNLDWFFDHFPRLTRLGEIKNKHHRCVRFWGRFVGGRVGGICHYPMVWSFAGEA